MSRSWMRAIIEISDRAHAVRVRQRIYGPSLWRGDCLAVGITRAATKSRAAIGRADGARRKGCGGAEIHRIVRPRTARIGLDGRRQYSYRLSLAWHGCRPYPCRRGIELLE